MNFRCLSNGEVPPTKERLEYPPPDTNTGLTPGDNVLLNNCSNFIETNCRFSSGIIILIQSDS